MTGTAYALESARIPINNLPAGSLLVHATNCIAQWGAGIAAELAEKFPAACREYKRFCNEAKPSPSERWPPRSLGGRCLIIPPQQGDVDRGSPRIYIVCLFTSCGFGRPNEVTGKPGRDGMGKILAQTDESLKAFREQLGKMVIEEGKKAEDLVIYSPMFNSGAFRVPWDKTTALIKTNFRGWDGRWVVLEPPS